MDPSELKGRKLGRVLTKLKVVTREQVHEALAVQKGRTNKVKIGEILTELGYCTALDVDRALAGQAGMDYVDLAGLELDEETVGAIPAENAKAYQCVPIEYDSKSRRLKVALKSPENFQAVDDLRLLMGAEVEAVVASAQSIDALLEKHYAKDSSLSDAMSSIANNENLAELSKHSDQSVDLDAVIDAAGDNQVIKLLNLVLLQAIRDRASDIHFEPFENEFKMRYRIDGVLYEMVPPPKHLGTAITSRVKVMANLDIAERRLPQDGRIELTVGGNPVDLRVAILPTIYGESCVMRVLDGGNVELSLDRVGFRPDDLELFRGLIRKPNGIVIVTGPTGSGKTTTLYAALGRIDRESRNVMTIEDPVEYHLDGISQMQVNAKRGVTFATGLRSLLRQDPDVILVGEIRDPETAQLAIQASLTGHFVLATLHTNDAPSAIPRLLDIGVEPYLVTSSLVGVLAQRLLRRRCPHCGGTGMVNGEKCEHCFGTGYKGRLAVHELMLMNDQLRQLTAQRADGVTLYEAAVDSGFAPMKVDAMEKVQQGLTDEAEVFRVLH